MTVLKVPVVSQVAVVGVEWDGLRLVVIAVRQVESRRHRDKLIGETDARTEVALLRKAEVVVPSAQSHRERRKKMDFITDVYIPFRLITEAVLVDHLSDRERDRSGFELTVAVQVVPHRI